ncbi:phosphatidylglycerophosphatase A [Thalassospira australica]|uniref:phosphatidylglycerophosphatase A family protein n=1 Tax=Thalassospira australica TaxID=1528106 RepID=UPI00384EF539
MRLSQFMLTCAATWFYSGRTTKAPGTMGSLAAVPVGWAIAVLLGYYALAIGILAVFLIGIPIAQKYSKMIGVHDPGEIVIDEVAGQWLCILVVPLGNGLADLGWLAAAFVIFRIFDILKPWPIRWIDRRIGGGFGIMLDDILAGIFGMVILIGIRYFAGV